MDRHEAILKGAYKERDELQKKYERLQWAEQFHSDPYTFVDSWMDQLAGHPQYGQRLLAKAARMLQARRGTQPQTVEEPQPDVPIVDGNNNVTGHTYSAAQLKKWREWDWAQKQSTFDQRIAPLEQMKQTLEQQQVQAAIRQQSNQHAASTLEKMRQQSWFTEHEAAIKQHFAAHDEYGDNLQAAALDYFNEHVLPTYGQKAESKVLADLKTQANGAAIRPDGAGSGLPDFKKMKPEEVMRFMHEHPDIAATFANR